MHVSVKVERKWIPQKESMTTSAGNAEQEKTGRKMKPGEKGERELVRENRKKRAKDEGGM